MTLLNCFYKFFIKNQFYRKIIKKSNKIFIILVKKNKETLINKLNQYQHNIITKLIHKKIIKKIMKYLFRIRGEFL